MEQKQHKPWCMANISCLVIHLDGKCPGPYGRCTCETPQQTEIPPTSYAGEEDENATSEK